MCLLIRLRAASLPPSLLAQHGSNGTPALDTCPAQLRLGRFAPQVSERVVLKQEVYIALYKAAAPRAGRQAGSEAVPQPTETTTSGDSTSTRAGSGLAHGDSPQPAPGNALQDTAQAKPAPPGAVCAAVVASQPEPAPAQQAPAGTSRPLLTPQPQGSSQQAAQAGATGRELAGRKRGRGSSPDPVALGPPGKAARAAADPAKGGKPADSLPATRGAAGGGGQVPPAPAAPADGAAPRPDQASTASRGDAAALPGSPAPRCTLLSCCV